MRVSKLWPAIIAFAASATLIACTDLGLSRLSTGATSDAVRAQLGAPTDERTLPDGKRAWDYVRGPMGFTTWRVTFDSSGRASQVEQLLNERAFTALNAGGISKAEVLNRIGRPGQVIAFPRLGSEVWTYRFMELTDQRLAEIHFDAASGGVRYVTTYPDPAMYSAPDM